MKILIACEFSGIVRDAFIAKGHDAVSCDILQTERPGPHMSCDALDVLGMGWDMMIAHPPCTYLCCTGNKWMKPEYAERFPTRAQDRLDAIDFFMAITNAHIDKIATENPVGIMSTHYRKPDQYVQPWMFGDEFSKKTGLWLKNLPKLVPTKIVGKGEIVTYKSGRRAPKWYESCTKKNRSTVRSRTFQGIADAMADQWG